MRPPARISLVQLFVVATLGTALALGGAGWAFVRSAQRSIVERSDALRDAEARRIGDRVSMDLGVAASALAEVERAMQLGVLSGTDPAAVEARLFSQLADNPTLSDVSFTGATLLGHDDAGEARLAPDGRWQVSVFRASATPPSAIVTRRITLQHGAYEADLRTRAPGQGLLDAPFTRGPVTGDPTAHDTFSVSAARANYGRAIWSDLSYSELDAAMPQDERRVVVTVQKAVEDAPGHFAGVLRVGLLARTIDALPRAGDSEGPERVALCDDQGRLVARLAPADRVEPIGNDLRVVASHAPAEVVAALAPPLRSRSFVVGGATYLVTFRRLDDSQEWTAAVIAPEDYYTRDLRALRDRFLWALLAGTAVVLAAGGLVLRQVRRALGRVVATTGRMRRFDFAPSPADAPLREVQEVMESVERAKTATRALGKYVPVDLVRRLFEANAEPVLGGELCEVSLMFTDIEGFTSLAERLSPDALARALGAYLEAMTRGVTSTAGTVDKFIGDAVMAFWNAPTPVSDHAVRACRAALACQKATAALYASEAWSGLAPLFTRFGLHTARVMVGHFGAPERLSYTALGDGVNLAARLEPLCKQYGVAVLASEAIVEQARSVMAFRLVDRVAVKGKSQSVRVYELLGELGAAEARATKARAYEAALESYFARDFARACAAFRALEGDGPSAVMAARCEQLLASPPTEDWNGVWIATSK